MPHCLPVFVSLACVLCACGSSHEEVAVDDAGARVACVVRGSRLTVEGCLTAERPFAEALVAPGQCLHTDQVLCIEPEPDASWSGVWTFSGAHYDGLAGRRPCDAETLALARSAPACDAAADCAPCDADAGGLCGLAPPCNP